MIPHEVIGSVELLARRVYALDAATQRDALATGMVVEPGAYPVYRTGEAIYWVMTGRINARNIAKIGDGTFAMTSSDEGVGPVLTFPSGRFAPDDFADLLAHPTCREGDPGQRLRFTLTASVR